jgi:hypothetical protein
MFDMKQVFSSLVFNLSRYLRYRYKVIRRDTK